MRRYWGTSPIGSRRTKPPISTPDAGVTGARGSGGHGRASRRGAERSEIAKSRGRTGLATPETTRRPLHPLRGATPVTGRDTRSEGVHCLRIGCSAPNHKNKRGICETTTDTTRRPLHPLRGATPVTGRDTRSEGVHCLRIGCSAPNHKNKRGICETIADTHKAPGARAPGASAHSDQPTLHVAPSRPSVTVTSAAARRSRSSSARAQSLAAGQQPARTAQPGPARPTPSARRRPHRTHPRRCRPGRAGSAIR